MAKCPNNHHNWVVMCVAPPKVWVICKNCPEKFPFGPEQSGMRFTGKLPNKYLPGVENNA